MNQDRAHRALARGLFVLVSPAAVVGERLALEELGIVGSGLVHQHQQDFAFHIHALVVVPLIFGGLNAVAHINDVCIYG